MSERLPLEITSGLRSLRRRIRRIQATRGFLRLAGLALTGLMVVVACDFFLAPLSLWARATLFCAWVFSIVIGSFLLIVRPLTRPMPLVKLARWLEHRHPEIQERLSTSLELSESSEGMSPALLASLSQEAILDIASVDPRAELRGSITARSLWPVLGSLAVIAISVGVWPREVGRLLTRAVSPFSDLGNAGAFQFTFHPGDLRLLEGDSATVKFTYEGDLTDEVEFVMTKAGEETVETLRPVTSEGKRHRFSYPIFSARENFTYSARVARSESDRYRVEVFPLPKLQGSKVTMAYPRYTGWPERSMSLGTEIEALAGSKITLEGRIDSLIKKASVEFSDGHSQAMTLDASARGTSLSWQAKLSPGFEQEARVMVEHELGRELEAARFLVTATEDPAPVVTMLTPQERKFQVCPTEQVIMTYEAIEEIEVAQVFIELEVDGASAEPLAELLPERIDERRPELWEGEAMVFLGTVLQKYPEARQLRMRLAVADGRPPELAGPGVGYSEWLEFRLNDNAPSLVRQELRHQERDIEKSIDEAIRKVNGARNKMHEAKGALHEEEVSERAEKALQAAQEKLVAAQAQLTALGERMEQTLHRHRRDQLAPPLGKLREAVASVENAPLQDTSEERRSEVDLALRESEQAIRDLEKLKREVQEDRPKTEAYARLQELAQRQEELARQAGQEMAQDWEKRQRRMMEQIRQQVRDSPEAKAAALTQLAEEAQQLAEEAAELQRGQEQLAAIHREAVEEASFQRDLRAALAREQEALVEEAAAELARAREGLEARANDLPEVLAQAQAALSAAREGEPEAAAEAAKQAAAELAKTAEGVASQERLQKRQQELAKAFRDVGEGRSQKALGALQAMQAARGQELTQRLQEATSVEGQPLHQATQLVEQGTQRAMQASELATSEQSASKHGESAQKFGQAKSALKAAADQLRQQATQAAQQQAGKNAVPALGEEMAEALKQSSQAAASAKSGQPGEAAGQAQAAAEALKEAARQARSNLQQGKAASQAPEPNQAGSPAAPGNQTSPPSDESQADLRVAQADQGVPPELAKLGVSAADWEKIQSSLQTDVSGSQRAIIPEDYRGLVQKYFEQVTRKK